MPMRGELPITTLMADQSDRSVGANWFAVGIFTVIGLAVSLGVAIAFPISLSAVLQQG